MFLLRNKEATHSIRNGYKTIANEKHHKGNPIIDSLKFLLKSNVQSLAEAFKWSHFYSKTSILLFE